MPAMAICTDRPGEAVDGVSRHLERADDVPDRLHRLVGRELERRREHVAVEDHVQVLVLRDPREQLLADGVLRVAAGVAVRDAGGELLERHVRHRVEHVEVVGAGEALRHVHHAFAFERHRVDGAGGQQVVADRDAVPSLLGGPAADPRPPGTVRAEGLVDVAVIARQVVLGQQVDDEGGARDLAHP